MSAEQMVRDGISRIRTWTKPKRIGCASVQFPIERPFCGSCHKRASYKTPRGNRCATHARPETDI